MEKIVYKFVMNNAGLLSGIELWQGSQHITLSMAAPGTHNSGYRWAEVKDFIDRVKLPVLDESQQYTNIVTQIMDIHDKK